MLWSLLVGAALAQECADPTALSLDARDKMLGGEFDAAAPILAEARDALRCGAQPSPEQLVEYWLSDAAYRFFNGDPGYAERLLIAAYRTDPELWDPRLGLDLQALHQKGAEPAPAAMVTIQRLPRNYKVTLDASRARPAAETTAGNHYVAVLGRNNQVQQDWMIQLAPEQDLALVADPLPRLRRPAYLVSAGVAAVTATGLAVAAKAKGRSFETFTQSSQVADLEAAYAQQRALGIGAYTMMGATVGLATLYLYW